MRPSPAPHRSRALAGFLAASLAAGATLSCNDDVAGTSTETITGKTVGALYLADGKPARGARVRVLPVGYQPLADSGASLAFRTSTDDEGRFYIDSLASGEYNILGDLEGDAAYQDSVFLSGTGRTLAPDTLEESGIVSGRVALQPGDPLASATVQVLGTLAYANVEDDGSFTLPSLAAGLYRAAVSSDLPGYTAQFASIRVRSGRTDTLSDTLRPRFTGIPQVSGFGAEFDTLGQKVRLTWSTSRYANLQEYRVFRDKVGSVQQSPVAIAAVRDTVFVDSLFRALGGLAAEDTGRWEYRVAIRDKFGDVGRSFGALEVKTPPKSSASTVIDLRRVNTLDGVASIGDTVRLVADYRSASRGLKMIRWFKDAGDQAVRTVLAPPKSGADTLVFVCPGAASTHLFRIEIADEGGAEWKVSGAVQVKLDAPSIRMAPTARGLPGSLLALHADVKDTLGRIAKIEWDFGGTGLWTPTLSNDTLALLPSNGVLAYPCIARVTDDDGLTATDTTLVYVTPWVSRAIMPAPVSGQKAVVADGRIHVLGANFGLPNSRVDSFDPSRNAWESKANMIDQRVNFAAAESGGRIYVFGGVDAGGQSINKAERYDPATNAWIALPDMPGKRHDHAAAAVGGKIYLIGGASYGMTGQDRRKTIDVYDTATGSWSSFTTAIPFELQMRSATVGSHVYVFSLYRMQSGEFSRFDPVANTWSPVQNLPFGRKGDYLLTDFAVHALGERVVLAGGQWAYAPPQAVNTSVSGIYAGDVNILDPGTGTWTSLLPMNEPATAPSLAAVGKDLYLLGGGARSGIRREMETYIGLE